MIRGHAWAMAFVIGYVLAGCSDRGSIPEYNEVSSLDPRPGETDVDKGRFILIELKRPVGVSEAGKIRLRYVNDTTSIANIAGCGLTPPYVTHLCVGPFIWKPGRTVEVVIPKEITDTEGRTMERDLTYRFSIAQDAAPFQLLASVPAMNDTITLSPFTYVSGRLIFNDYLFVTDSVLTITPPAGIHPGVFVICEGRGIPSREVPFIMDHLTPGSTYEITVPVQMKDYEGEMLPQEYRIVFHTRP